LIEKVLLGAFATERNTVFFTGKRYGHNEEKIGKRKGYSPVL
jgi:hypothetical protein